MTLLNKLFTMSDGIIVEPSEPDNISYWEFLFGSSSEIYPGFFIASLVIVVIGGILSLCLRRVDFIVVSAVLAGIISLSTLSVSVVEFMSKNNGFTGYDAEVVAEQLSEHYNTKITEDEISESGLIDSLASGDEVSKLQYFSDTDRDPKTGEWVNSTKFFMVDGKVVEIYIESEPLKGNFLESNK